MTVPVRFARGIINGPRYRSPGERMGAGAPSLGHVTAMNLDEQLRRAFDALSDRLKDDLAARAKTLSDELTAAAEAERAEAVAEAARNAWAAAERESNQRLVSRVSETEVTLRADAQRREAAAAERLLVAIQAIDRGQSLSEILLALVTAAAAEAHRTATLLRKDARLQSWRMTGFDDAMSALDLAVAESGILGDATRTGKVIRTGPPPAFAALPPDRPAVAIPLVMSGQIFAVLYADQGATDEKINDAWMATLEVLTRHAARALEAVTAVRLAQVASERAKLPDGQIRIRN
jgi:GAF domain